ncbi:MAG: Hsp33 family molecular chaperone HslO [Bacillota bacterium]
MQDYLVRGTGADGMVRIKAAVTAGLVEYARRCHNTFPVATAALGRCLTAGCMMGVDLTGKETITLRVLGDGPLGALVVVGEAGGTVRGYVENPEVNLPSRDDGKIDVGRGVGQGILAVTKDLRMREPYISQIPLISGEIAEDLTQYFWLSEQAPTAVALGVMIDKDGSVISSGGYMVQLMPGATDELAAIIEQKLLSLPPVTELFSNKKTPEAVLELLLEGFSPVIFQPEPLSFQCNCSPERFQRALAGLGEAELASMREEGGAELRCHFCNRLYRFSAEELGQLREETTD